MGFLYIQVTLVVAKLRKQVKQAGAEKKRLGKNVFAKAQL